MDDMAAVHNLDVSQHLISDSKDCLEAESAPVLVKLGGSKQFHHEVVGIFDAEVMVMDLGEAGGAFLSIEGDCRPYICVDSCARILGVAGWRLLCVSK